VEASSICTAEPTQLWLMRSVATSYWTSRLLALAFTCGCGADPDRKVHLGNHITQWIDLNQAGVNR